MKKGRWVRFTQRVGLAWQRAPAEGGLDAHLGC